LLAVAIRWSRLDDRWWLPEPEPEPEPEPGPEPEPDPKPQPVARRICPQVGLPSPANKSGAALADRCQLPRQQPKPARLAPPCCSAGAVTAPCFKPLAAANLCPLAWQ
jgi:hypothetical protein